MLIITLGAIVLFVMDLFSSNWLYHLSISVFLCFPDPKPATGGQYTAMGTTCTPKSAKLMFIIIGYRQREGTPQKIDPLSPKKLMGRKSPGKKSFQLYIL